MPLTTATAQFIDQVDARLQQAAPLGTLQLTKRRTPGSRLAYHAEFGGITVAPTAPRRVRCGLIRLLQPLVVELAACREGFRIQAETFVSAALITIQVRVLLRRPPSLVQQLEEADQMHLTTLHVRLAAWRQKLSVLVPMQRLTLVAVVDE
ncbi:hypothetical protein SAMN06265337_1219 [Hymenobacter gelipurpurascens]|uniref:Uncharacterized protein n=1 Tax=Hymenobacter gelipurpurascens TaxID=89968 RepID=A0A212TGE6_9BACT|nr:hypothetical protein [Hymenobacter gelipurpurascens]SNC65118.1 hypothetical protein SAMN06265337_1219 [Hymenobacter gelipurpurascens]